MLDVAIILILIVIILIVWMIGMVRISLQASKRDKEMMKQRDEEDREFWNNMGS